MSSSNTFLPIAQAQRPLFAGIDVGGTNIKIGMVDDQGSALGYLSIPTEEQRGPEDAVRRMAAGLECLLREHHLGFDDLAGVGLGTPGTMDIPRGLILEPPNLPHWRHFAIRDALSRACGRPVTFANDANAAAYGEFWVGSGRAFQSIVLLTLGTGVGCGIIIGDMSIDGETSHGGECGHIIIDYHDDARLCACGQRGHLEAYASATALIKRAQEALDSSSRRSSIRRRVEGGESLSGLLIAEEAEAGDALAIQLVMDTALYLGVGIVSLIHTIDPGAVILGGAMNFSGKDNPIGRRFLDRISEIVHERCFPVPAQHVVVDFASLGGDAGFIGAAGLARVEYRKH